jgi:hypothetical protein
MSALHDTDEVGMSDEPRCRVCGCTDDEACPGGCSWVPDPELLGDLCSVCLPLVEAVLVAAHPVDRQAGLDTAGGDLAELLEACCDCMSLGRECDYHRGVADGWDGCVAFMAGWVDHAGHAAATGTDRAPSPGARDVFDTRIAVRDGS